MPRNSIYIWNNGAYDVSRWISLAHRGPDTCVLHLTDLCQPGAISRLTSVSIPTHYLDMALRRGGLQITLANGFLLIQRLDELITLEFKSRDEISIVKAAFKAADFIEKIETESGSLALTV